MKNENLVNGTKVQEVKSGEMGIFLHFDIVDSRQGIYEYCNVRFTSSGTGYDRVATSAIKLI